MVFIGIDCYLLTFFVPGVPTVFLLRVTENYNTLLTSRCRKSGGV